MNHFTWSQLVALMTTVLIQIFSSSNASASSFTGVWQGSYNCSSKKMLATLTVMDADDSGRTTALFEFRRSVDKPTSAYGSFTYDVQRRRGKIHLISQEWVRRPRGFYMVNIVGSVDKANGVFTGSLQTPGCGGAEFKYVGAHGNNSNGDIGALAGGQEKQTNLLNGTLSARGAIAPDKLEGRWAPVILYVDDRSLNRKASIKRKLLDVVYDFERTGDGRYNANMVFRNSGKVFSTANLVVRKSRGTFALKLESNSAAIRDSFPAYSITPKRSVQGVDIMTNVTVPTTRQNQYFIRFRDTAGAREAGIDRRGYAQFCGVTARDLAAGAKLEKGLLETLASDYPRVASKFSTQEAISLALFGTESFADVIGDDFKSLSTDARTTLIERLRVCAIYHHDRSTADVIAEALFGSRFTFEAVKGDIGRSYRRNKPLESIASSLSIVKNIDRAELSRKALASALAHPTQSVFRNEATLGARKALYDTHAYNLLPTEIVDNLSALEAALEAKRTRDTAARELELDRTAPAAPKDQLIASAARKYILNDCNRAALAVRSADGNSLISIAMARSIKPQGRNCVIESATHVLSFNIRAVTGQKCTATDPAQCEFLAYWSCSYELNRSFGFSGNTVNIDPVCPLVRSTPVNMKGIFERKAPRRWIASHLEW